MSEERKKVSCAFCQKEIWDDQALKVREHFLCEECELKLVQSPVWDVAYPAYVEKVKEFWINKQ